MALLRRAQFCLRWQSSLRKSASHLPVRLCAMTRRESYMYVYRQISQAVSASPIHCQTSVHCPQCRTLPRMFLKVQRDMSSSVECETSVPVLQGLFHVDLSRESHRTDQESLPPRGGKTRMIDNKEVQYAYNKEMISPSAYLRRERSKLMATPRTEKELYHAKYTPRLFYLERDEYSKTAVCLPRDDIHNADAFHLPEEEFLDRIAADKDSYYPVDYLMDCIQSLSRRSDDWLIDLNNDARFLRLSLILGVMGPTMSDEELGEVLSFLARVQVRTRNRCLSALHDECCKRVDDLSLRSRLLFLDAWRMIGYPTPHLAESALASCVDDVPRMTPPELLQLAYLIGENRRAPDGLEKRLVDLLPGLLPSLTLTELGGVCTALFKSSSAPPTADLMAQVADHACSSEIQSIHSFFVVGILKHFRRQYVGYQHFFQYIANAVSPLLHIYPVTSCMQILLSYASLHVLHPQLCDTMAVEITDKVDQWRSKDATKIMWSYGTLQYLPADQPAFLPTVLGQLIGLQGDMEEYPINLVTSLLSLAYLQLYPWELLHRLFSKDFLQSTANYMAKTGIDLRRDILLLHRSLEIECPEYDGNKLDESWMLQSDDIPSSVVPGIGQQLTSRTEVRFIAGLVRAVVGRRENYRIHPILPHVNTLDIEVRLDEHNDPISFNVRPTSTLGQEGSEDSMAILPFSRRNPNPQKCKNAVALSSSLIADLTRGGPSEDKPARVGAEMGRRKREKRKMEGWRESENRGSDDGEDKLWNVRRILQKPVPAPHCSNEKWLAIVVWARNHSHYGGQKLLGQHAMKRRQLELLGYHVVDVPYHEWSQLMKGGDQQESLRYMRRKIFNNSSSTTMR